MEAVAALAGWTMTEWQKDVIRDWSLHDEGGRWIHRRCGASVPRQAGKSVDAILWVLFLTAVLGYRVLWTDHNYSTTCEMLRRFRDIYGKRANDPDAPQAFNSRVKSSTSKTAQEKYEFTNGGVLCFSTRTESASLGFSFDIIIYDEAQLLTDEQMQTLQPTTSSGPHHNTQAILVGTPTRAGCAATKFRDMRDEAWDETPPDDLCWIEYGLSEVGDVNDESRWALANPSISAGVADIDALRTGIRLMGSDELGIAQEYLGYWTPKVESENAPVITADEWQACEVERAPGATDDERVAYGVKFSPDGATVALAAAARQGERVHVELVKLETTAVGTGWLASWLCERTAKATAVAIDGKSGAGALVEALAGTPRNYVIRPTAADVTTAAVMTLNGVRDGTLTHIKSQALDTAATTCTRRAIGSAGGWSWGGETACAMDAVSLALWASKTSRRNPRRKGMAA